MEWNVLYSKQEQPTIEQIEAFVNSELWQKLDRILQENFKTKPKLEHSSCSWQPGWNIKYKKSGKSLCILYPMKDYFIVNVVVNESEMHEAEALISLCSEYVQDVFANTKVGIGRKSVMFDVENDETLKAIIGLIELRANALGLIK